MGLNADAKMALDMMHKHLGAVLVDADIGDSDSRNIQMLSMSAGRLTTSLFALRKHRRMALHLAAGSMLGAPSTQEITDRAKAFAAYLDGDEEQRS